MFVFQIFVHFKHIGNLENCKENYYGLTTTNFILRVRFLLKWLSKLKPVMQNKNYFDKQNCNFI